ncbi:hypothetical protein KY284_021336 [Solanum tuberosum]|nr:hypothetical protein KY284_021336 [Solanum tuberosum]
MPDNPSCWNIFVDDLVRAVHNFFAEGGPWRLGDLEQVFLVYPSCRELLPRISTQGAARRGAGPLIPVNWVAYIGAREYWLAAVSGDHFLFRALPGKQAGLSLKRIILGLMSSWNHGKNLRKRARRSFPVRVNLGSGGEYPVHRNFNQKVWPRLRAYTNN